MLAPGTGETHRAYLWAYASGAFESMRAAVYDFTESRSGQHPRTFLGHGTESAWTGSLVCDDYAGYKALFLDGDIIEVGCMAHARAQVRGAALDQQEHPGGHRHRVHRTALLHRAGGEGRSSRGRLRERRTRPALVAQALHKWFLQFRSKVPDRSATAKAMDYSLHRWAALTRYLDAAALPIDNNFDEQQIRPWATGRKNWLVAGTLLAGQRAAAIMSLIQTAKLNGHAPTPICTMC
jgi:hypothetical protein